MYVQCSSTIGDKFDTRHILIEFSFLLEFGEQKNGMYAESNIPYRQPNYIECPRNCVEYFTRLKSRQTKNVR